MLTGRMIAWKDEVAYISSWSEIDLPASFSPSSSLSFALLLLIVLVLTV